MNERWKSICAVNNCDTCPIGKYCATDNKSKDDWNDQMNDAALNSRAVGAMTEQEAFDIVDGLCRDEEYFSVSKGIQRSSVICGGDKLHNVSIYLHGVNAQGKTYEEAIAHWKALWASRKLSEKERLLRELSVIEGDDDG